MVVGALCAVATMLAAGAAPAPAAAPADLVGQWRFDEPGGQSAVDDGSFGLHGGLGSTDWADAEDPQRIGGFAGGALHFTGTQFVRVPDVPALALRNLTAEAVVRAPASPGSYRYVISRGSKGCLAGSYGLYSGQGGGLAFYVFDGTHYVVSATARISDIWDGGWHHVAGTFDGQALRLFVDGRPVGDPMAAPLLVDYAETAPGAFLGRYGGDCNLGFSGDMDLVRLSARAHSAQEIAAAAGATTGVGPGGPGAAAVARAGHDGAQSQSLRPRDRPASLHRARLAPARGGQAADGDPGARVAVRRTRVEEADRPRRRPAQAAHFSPDQPVRPGPSHALPA